jgi:hypothetical protein
MDTWEDFFREKSARRASIRDYRAIIGWALAALGLVALVTALLIGLDGLL